MKPQILLKFVNQKKWLKIIMNKREIFNLVMMELYCLIVQQMMFTYGILVTGKFYSKMEMVMEMQILFQLIQVIKDQLVCMDL